MHPEDPDLRADATRVDSVHHAFARKVSNLANAVSRVRGVRDAKAIHDLRVAARRLEAMLRTWDGVFPARPRTAALRVLRKVRRRFGEARELEVHVALLEPHVAAENDAVLRVLQKMRKRLERRSARAIARLRPKRLKRVLRRLETPAGEHESLGASDPHAFDRARMRAREAGAMAHAAVELAGEQPDDWTQHEARIAIKKWRYTIECVDDRSAPANDGRIQLLREIQDSLGAAHDRATLIEAIERFGAEENPLALQHVIDALEAEKTAALEKFESLAASLSEARGAALGRTPRTPPDLPRPERPAVPLSSERAPQATERSTAEPATPERWQRMAKWLEESAGKN